jgi:hypothetical protein
MAVDATGFRYPIASSLGSLPSTVFLVHGAEFPASQAFAREHTGDHNAGRVWCILDADGLDGRALDEVVHAFRRTPPGNAEAAQLV